MNWPTITNSGLNGRASPQLRSSSHFSYPSTSITILNWRVILISLLCAHNNSPNLCFFFTTKQNIPTNQPHLDYDNLFHSISRLIIKLRA